MIWTFEKTDMFKAKDILGDTCCIAGNVCASQIYVSTAEEVKDYAANLSTIAVKAAVIY
jgi:uroporphyrinogen-III decarboxylase